MKIAGIGFAAGGNRITVSYDTVNKNFFVDEVYKDKDLGVTIEINYSVKSKQEAKESLERFKKDFMTAERKML